jgi:hypothetical protein
MNLGLRSAVLALAFAATACGDDSPSSPDDNENPGTPSKVLTGTANGASWTATVVTGGFLNGNVIIAGNNGTSGSNGTSSLSINMAGVPGPGTYNLGPGNGYGLAQWINGDVGVFSTLGTGGTGSITITTATLSRLAGTFTFVARNTVAGAATPSMTVTNGVFNITNP